MAKKNEEQLEVRTPAYLTKHSNVTAILQAMAENLEGEKLTRFDFPRITIPTGGGDYMTIPNPDGAEPAKQVSGVIIYTHMARSYWKDSGDDVGNGPPDCSADNAKVGIGDPGGICDVCPNAAFKTGKGGRGQACKLMRNIYLLVGQNMMPYMVQVPPTSLKEAKKYLWNLSVQDMRYFNIETTLGVLGGQKNKSNQPFSTWTFARGRELEAEERQKVQAYAFEFREALGVEAAAPVQA